VPRKDIVRISSVKFVTKSSIRDMYCPGTRAPSALHRGYASSISGASGDHALPAMQAVNTADHPPLQASVVFLNVPEFERRPIAEQARLRAQLEVAVAITIAEIPPDARIVLDGSDSVAIAILADPAAALRVAERMQAAVTAGLPLGIGVNHGAVRQVANGGEGSFIGDGIATAATLAGFAANGTVYATRTFRDALARAEPALKAVLRPAGTMNDTSLRSHELFKPDRAAAERRRRRWRAFSAALLVAGIGAGIALRATVNAGATSARPAAVERVSAAVGEFGAALRRRLGGGGR
jgi:hypothetical protein